MAPGTRAATRRWPIIVVAFVFAMAAPAAAPGAFPGTDPDESPRLNTPNDPEFDNCESDDEPPNAPGDACSYADEQYNLFGFSPDSAQVAPPLPEHPQYAAVGPPPDCPVAAPGTTSQLDAEGKQANTLASEAQQCAQISGIRADTAWKYFGKYDSSGPVTVGDPNVSVAILDTGIRWADEELRTKVRLNVAELPTPLVDRAARIDTGTVCNFSNPGNDDANGDGAVNVTDFACDSRVEKTAGDDTSDHGANADSVLDASDLIATFSDATDADSNGYVDDIAGWDFFDDDNDPYDVSSCCSANGHGTGRAKEAVAATNNGTGGAGICPDCQLMPLRVWDTFVVPTDNYATAAVYAADNGASVVEGAVGGLTNTQFARRAFTYVDSKGVSLMLVSSDINSANHNYPTNYNEAMYVAGSLYDTAPFGACNGPGGLPGIGDFPVSPPQEFIDGCQEFQQQLSSGCGPDPPANLACVNFTGQPTTSSFFRNSNLTQYGGKADIVLMGATGSENTGQSAGAAGLIHSFGRLWFAGGGTIPANPGAGGPPRLSGNEVRQLLTMTAEDVQPENTGVIGTPDKAEEGWDTHFGYGRVNLAGALARISNDPVGPPASPPGGWPCDTDPAASDPVDPNCVPPEAQLDAPDWFSPIDVDRVPDGGGVDIKGRIAAPHSNSGVGDWEVEYACGQQPAESAFQTLATGSGAQPAGSTLATIPKATLQSLADTCDGSVGGDFGRPAGSVANAWPADPYPTPDPERHAFQLRLTVHEQDDPANVGQYRKTLFAYNDDGNLDGWPQPVGSGSNAGDYVTGSGGEQSTRLYDLDGDNELDVLLPTSSGELWALDSAGDPLQSFNNGQPVTTDPNALASHIPGADGLPAPRESLRTPAIGDIDGDLEPEIVATAGEHVYAWDLDGSRVASFPVRLDPALSDPCKPGAPHPCFNVADRAITSDNHIKRGFISSPALADLDLDGKLDIVAGALDQHVYAWNGNGQPMPGFPSKLSTPGTIGAEIITSPAIAELDGDPGPEIVSATNEVTNPDPAAPSDPFQLLNVFLGQATGANPVYAINADGTPVPGWPVEVGVAAGDLLPFVLPGHDAAVVDVDGGTDEVSVSAATSLAGQGSQLVDGSGTTVSTYEDAAANTLDQSPVLNLADYTSVGNVSGLAKDVWAVKGGLTANGAANLLAPNQNLPFSHVEQAWDISTGAPTAPSAPGYPRATDDFQLLSQASIARVAGSGPGRQMLVGTGLYQLHAYDSTGQEATGWPKFTGGWNEPTPAVGDADGDGELEVTGYTREGWSFLWSTGVDACDDSNNEWWTLHHDERGTSNYGTDSRPPGTPENLTAQRNGSTVTLSWTAPGDDWMCGSAEKLRVLASNAPIQHPGQGTQIREEDVSVGGGQNATLDLTDAELNGATHIAIFYRDEADNWGLLADVQVPAQAGGGGGGGGEPTPEPTPNPPSSGTPGPCSNVIAGTSGADNLHGTEGPDKISGKGGADKIKGGPGDDCLRGGRARDRISGGTGDDTIHVRGGRSDRVNCGPGDDTVTASAADHVSHSCETVKG